MSQKVQKYQIYLLALGIIIIIIIQQTLAKRECGGPDSNEFRPGGKESKEASRKLSSSAATTHPPTNQYSATNGQCYSRGGVEAERERERGEKREEEGEREPGHRVQVQGGHAQPVIKSSVSRPCTQRRQSDLD